MGEIERLLHKDREEILDFCDRHRFIFIYGAGKVAKDMILYLEEEKVCIKGVIVGNGHKKEENYCGYPVIEINDWKPELSDGIILGISYDKQDGIFCDLLHAGVDKRNIYFQKIFGWKSIAPHMEESAVFMDENSDGEFFKFRNELNELGICYETDKNSQYHNYLRKYEFFLETYKNCEVNILELGVLNGGSLNMWEKYFKKAYIYGVDVNTDCKKYESGRKKILLCDLSKKESYEELKKLEAMIIVDDASHLWSHQIKALCYLFPSLANGGIYIIEDLGTNFLWRCGNVYEDASISCYELLREIEKVVVNGASMALSDMKPECVPFADEIFRLAEQMEMITFIRDACIMIKK